MDKIDVALEQYKRQIEGLRNALHQVQNNAELNPFIISVSYAIKIKDFNIDDPTLIGTARDLIHRVIYAAVNNNLKEFEASDLDSIAIQKHKLVYLLNSDDLITKLLISFHVSDDKCRCIAELHIDNFTRYVTPTTLVLHHEIKKLFNFVSEDDKYVIYERRLSDWC